MELFKNKESRKEKCDSNNNWKTARPRMILEWPLLLGLIRICMKNVEFCGKRSKFLPKRCLFIFCIFYLNEKELNQQVCLIKYVENEISNSTSHKKKRERSKLLVTNYHKLSPLPQECMGYVFDCSIGSPILMLVS